MGLLSKAATTATTTKPADKKQVILVKDEQFGQVLKDWTEAKIALAETSATEERTKAMIASEGLRQFASMYAQTGTRPASFRLQGTTGASAMVVPMDSWRKVNEEEIPAIMDELKTAGIVVDQDKIFDVQTTFGLNPAIVTKHFDAIEKALMSLDIPAEDLNELITARKSVSVKKGLLDQIGGASKASIPKMLDILQPTISLRQ